MTAEGCSFLSAYLRTEPPIEPTCDLKEPICEHCLLALRTEVDEVMWDVEYTVEHLAQNWSEYRSWTPQELDAEFDRHLSYLVRMRLMRTRMWDREIDWKDVTMDLEFNSARHIVARIILECEYRLWLMGKITPHKEPDPLPIARRLDDLRRRSEALASGYR